MVQELAERPRVIVFDVNETLSDMSPLAARLEDVGAPPHLAATWFAGVLRDGFALAAAGADHPFAEIASDALSSHLGDLDLSVDTPSAVRHVMDGFAGLDVHPDVPEAIRALDDLGIRLVTLSNGAASVAAALLDRAGVRDRFEQLLSVEDAGRWKPARAAYSYALTVCEVEAHEAMLVAVHPWDIDGAARAGLSTAWINRTGHPYAGHFTEPGATVTSLHQLVDQLR
ncbi:haloacid dehalogenase type II [Aeromicrobium sp. CF3.5]|uniref:haloacid dehalogenase type II n=1 Tax=Aeromicrobium sp. CF3.5 TaxID=3373078 RepID=UPI003EE7E064